MEPAGPEKQEQGKSWLTNVLQIDKKQIQVHLDQVVRSTVKRH
jgi:hypothetical protein